MFILGYYYEAQSCLDPLQHISQKKGKNPSLTETILADSVKSMEKSLGARPGDAPVPEDDKD